MQSKIFIIFLFLFFWLLINKPVFAEDFRVSGKILDQKNNPVTQGSIVFIDGTGKTIAAATTDTTGFYQISVVGGTYTITANGARGAGLQESALINKTISVPTVLNFTLHAPNIAVSQKPNLKKSFAYSTVFVIVLLLLIFVGYIFYRRRVALTKIQ